jgi:hypothetical protein
MTKLFSLLDPKKDIRTEYPELRDYPAFSKLSKQEMDFVWKLKNVSSPYYIPTYEVTNTVSKKIEKVFVMVFGPKASVQNKIKYCNQNFPDKIRAAMEQMEKFRPKVRLAAKLMAEKTFLSCMNTVDDAEASPKEKQEIMAKMPGLLAQIEGGFGITDSTDLIAEEGGADFNIQDQLAEEK